MFTITVDDKQPIVNMMLRLLERIDPDGNHKGTSDPMQAIEWMKGEPAEVAFLDVDMPGLNGIELAKKMQQILPVVNIIFITGYDEYMSDAFSLYASGYIMKPVTEKAIRDALSHLRYRPAEESSARIKVRCFGSFEVFVDGKPVHFGRSKAKELFAYLIDRCGAVCNNDSVTGALWPDEPASETVKSRCRVVISEMLSTFTSLGASDVIIHGVGGVAVDMGKVDCDYYRYLAGDPYALHAFQGEYMTQYDLGEETRMNLYDKMQ